MEKNTLLYSKTKMETGIPSRKLIVFDGEAPPREVDLDQTGKKKISFGRSDSCDLVLNSKLVSRYHGTMEWENGKLLVKDAPDSRNGIIWNGIMVKQCFFEPGDMIRIDSEAENIIQGVLILMSESNGNVLWKSTKIKNGEDIRIGRGKECDICLNHITVSMHHARICMEEGKFYLYDNKSTNGIYVNGEKISGKVRLHEKDVITITNSKLIFTSKVIYYHTFIRGIGIEARHIIRKVGRGKKQKTICNDVSLSLRPCELIAIIGDSGAGKTTLMEAISGYAKPEAGQVLVNGGDLYKMYHAFKNIIGYVPQKDIVYDNLTLQSLLEYAARLRLPDDTSPTERLRRIKTVLEAVGLTGHEETVIGRLSGGQKKRASIAIELLSDPELLFLDEPASGLDPGTERSLMKTLRNMADRGKTIILVTHSTLNLQMCDKIIFMGRGGNLCYCGNEKQAEKFFQTDNLVDIYELIDTQSEKWKKQYQKTVTLEEIRERADVSGKKKGKSKHGRIRQTGILCSRYLKILLNDRKRLAMVLLQAPLLAFLISLVADGDQFETYSATKSLLFALSCAAFWIGILNAIQEVCKERHILKREYMTGLHLSSYILSKFLILGGLCAVQSLLLLGVFGILVGMPQEKLLLEPWLEFFVTTFVTSLSAMAMGIFVSSIVKNPDRATTVAPILLLPQILFSGLLFELGGATSYISWFVTCRWSMEGYGTTANLNGLKRMVELNGKMTEIAHEAEDYFEFTREHLLQDWGIMLGFAAVFAVLSVLMLRSIRKKQ